MPTFNNTKTINFTQNEYVSSRPSNGDDGAYDKSIRFANKTVTLDLGGSDYGVSVFQVTYTGTLDYVSVGFFDPNGGFVSVSQIEDGLYKPVKTSLVLNEYILKNDSFVNSTNVFYVIVNVEDDIKSNLLNVCVSMGKRGTAPITSSATISYNCPIPLYEYETGLHVYSPYDAISGESKLTTKLYSKLPIESWVENTPIYASKGFNNPALPYYYGYGDNVYKVGGVFDRSYGTQMETTVTKKLFRKPKTTEEIFGPKLWFNSVDQTSDACTIPFIEGVGRLRSIIDKTTLVKPEQYRYYMGYDPTKKITSNDSVFRLYSMGDDKTYPVAGSTHALNKVLFGVVKGYNRGWNINDWRTASTIVGLSMLAPLGAAISTSSIGTTVAAWFEGLYGGFKAWGFGQNVILPFLKTAFWNPYALIAGIILLLLVIIFAKKTKRYRENCAQFLHHFTDTPYIEVSDESHDTILYRTPILTTVNDGFYCDGVYYYRQTGGKIISKELSYTFEIKYSFPGFFVPIRLFSMKADVPTLVTSYNKLIVLSYTSGKPLPHCGTGTIYYNNGNLTHNVTPNCCDLEIATETTITVENGTEFSCISQQDANNKALAVFNAAVDYAENYANYCKIIDDDLIGELNIRFTHELKIENIPTQANIFYDNRDNGGATIGKSLYFDASGCQKVLDGYYGVTGSTPFCTFYHTTNGVIDNIYYMSSSNSTTTTTGQPIITTNLDYSSNWFMTNSNLSSLEYITNTYDNDTSFNPNSLYTDPNLKKGFIKNLQTLEDFQIYNDFNTTSYSQANTGWYRPLIDWIGNDSFYYYRVQTITLNVAERCGSNFSRGFFINSTLSGIPTTTTNPVSMVVKVFSQNIGLSGTYNVKTSKSSPSTFVKYGNQIGSNEVVTGITITNITTPNPLNKTTYQIGSSTTCNQPPSSCDLVIVSTETVDASGPVLGSATITFTTSNGPSTYTLNGSPQGPCTSPLGIGGLNSNTEYTVVITDSSECTVETKFTLGESVFKFDADYIMLTYQFTNGSDLDTRTRIVSPFVGQDTQNEYLGWSCQSRWPTTGTAYLTWGGDNTGTGFESVLVDLNTFTSSYPSATEMVMDLRGFWFGSVGTNDVNVAATLWKGGAPTKSGFLWVNSTATATYNIDSVGKQITSTGAPNKSLSSGERIATLTYNLTTGNGSLNKNDTTTPTV
jgi:hypothetical protein